MEKTHSSNANNQVPLQKQLYLECEAMAKYAFTSGLRVPSSVVQTIESIIVSGPEEMMTTDEQPKNGAETVHAEEADSVSDRDQRGVFIKKLAWAHDKLSQIVSPTTPQTILMLNKEASKKRLLKFLGPIPLIRRLMVLACLATLLSIASSFAAKIYGNSGSAPTTISNLFNLFSYLFAAAMGASFTSLYRANRFIVSGTFDLKYESSYWIRFILGVIAGVILASFLGEKFFVESKHLQHITKPTLAMLGGFSSEVVYRIITRLADTIESLVSGETKDIIASKERESEARWSEKALHSRLKLASFIMRVQQQFHDDEDPNKIKKNLDLILHHFMQHDYDEYEKRLNNIQDLQNTDPVQLSETA
jgi:hypothetical protein